MFVHRSGQTPQEKATVLPTDKEKTTAAGLRLEATGRDNIFWM
jgi:hypothetical protein